MFIINSTILNPEPLLNSFYPTNVEANPLINIIFLFIHDTDSLIKIIPCIVNYNFILTYDGEERHSISQNVNTTFLGFI